MRGTANLLQLESYCNKQTKRYDEITVQVLSTVEATSPNAVQDKSGAQPLKRATTSAKLRQTTASGCVPQARLHAYLYYSIGLG